MNVKIKKISRSTKEQIKYLCHYMNANPQFAAGDYQSPLGNRKIEENWVQLKQALDELGPQRTVEQWKVCWRDQKRKARAEGGARNRASNATGNHVPVPDISENATMVLNAIGTEMAVGMGPEESMIGFNLVMELTPPQVFEPSVTPRHSPPRELASTSNQPPSAQQPALPPTRQPAASRVRRTLPPEQFLNAQLELNGLIRELITEVHRSNELREEHLNHLRSLPNS